MDLNQVTVYTPDVERSAEFYRLLGLIPIVDSSPRYMRFECPGGDSTFSLHYTETAEPGNPLVLYFECEDLDAKVTELQGVGVQFDSGPQDKEWLWREASLRDPDGNKLILYSAGENRKNPPWRIRPHASK